MKCIVIQTSPERTNAEPVTNEDGTPYVYATMAEARAELKANGYIYNRANQRYYINGTEYRAYILRADSEEYAEIMEQAEQQAAPEYIEPEHIQTVSGNKIYRSDDPVTGQAVFTVAGRDFWELAEARYFAQCNPAEDQTSEAITPEPAPYLIYENDPATDTAENRAAEDAANALISAYADAIGEWPAETDPEFIAAYRVAAEDVAQAAPATDQQRATVADMVEAIVQQAERIAAERIVPEAVEIYGNNYEDAVNHVAYTTYRLMTGERMPDTNEDFARLDRIMGYAAEIVPADPYPYQRHELEAYLGSAIDSYDVEAIEHESTEYDPKIGRIVWTPEAVRDLWSICERHELKA